MRIKQTIPAFLVSPGHSPDTFEKVLPFLPCFLIVQPVKPFRLFLPQPDFLKEVFPFPPTEPLIPARELTRIDLSIRPLKVSPDYRCCGFLPLPLKFTNSRADDGNELLGALEDAWAAATVGKERFELLESASQLLEAGAEIALGWC